MRNVNTIDGSADKNRAIRLGDLLIERGLLDQERLEQALKFKKEECPNKLLGEVLVELELVSSADVIATLADACDVPFEKIDPTNVDPNLIGILPKEFLDKNNVLPMSLMEDQLTIAIQDFTNIFLVEEIERLSNYKVQAIAATAENIREVRESYLPEENVFVIDEFMDEMAEGELKIVENEEADYEDIEGAASDSPVIKLVNYIIQGAILERASDIHIEPDVTTSLVRYRVDGALYDKMTPPSRMQPAVVSRIKIMAGMDISERRVPQDGGISVMVSGRPVDLRVSTMPGKIGEKVVMRVIDKQAGLLDLSSLGFGDTMLQKLRNIIRQPNGVVLVTGPTGSGKSTTLYGCLKEIVDETVNISTVEDPVEFNIPRVNQFQVHAKAGFTFAGALRALLRQDPDIIMVGEIRDHETAKIATESALTGHLVLSTLHTNDAPSAVTRLINMDVEPYLVAASLRGVLAQRLFQRICSGCKEAVEITPAMERVLEHLFTCDPPLEAVYKGTGCSKCRKTGYKGRVGVYELMIPNDEMLDAISRGATLQEIRQMACVAGYTTLREDAIEKVRAGLISVDTLFGANMPTLDAEQNNAATGKAA